MVEVVPTLELLAKFCSRKVYSDFSHRTLMFYKMKQVLNLLEMDTQSSSVGNSEPRDIETLLGASFG